MQKCVDLNKIRPRSLYWPSIICHSFNFETLSHSIALRSEPVVHGYPGLSWTWGALALSCLVCTGLGRLRFGVPKPGLGVPRSVLDMGLSDHRLSGQEHGVLDPGLTRLNFIIIYSRGNRNIFINQYCITCLYLIISCLSSLQFLAWSR